MTTTGASVNVPMNTQQRDNDIENKLRLYGIYQAFANKKVPSNKQIDVALNSVCTHPDQHIAFVTILTICLVHQQQAIAKPQWKALR